MEHGAAVASPASGLRPRGGEAHRSRVIGRGGRHAGFAFVKCAAGCEEGLVVILKHESSAEEETAQRREGR